MTTPDHMSLFVNMLGSSGFSAMSTVSLMAASVNLFATLIGILIYVKLRHAVRTNSPQAIESCVHAISRYELVSTWIVHITMFAVYSEYLRKNTNVTNYVLSDPDCVFCGVIKALLARIIPCPLDGDCLLLEALSSGLHAFTNYCALVRIFSGVTSLRTRGRSLVFGFLRLGTVQLSVVVGLLLLLETDVVDGKTRDMWLVVLGMSVAVSVKAITDDELWDPADATFIAKLCREASEEEGRRKREADERAAIRAHETVKLGTSGDEGVRGLGKEGLTLK